MSDFDLIIRNPRVVTRDQVIAVDIGIRAGKIAGITPGLRDSAPEEIDASGLHVLPGLIDSHVHFNDPGRSDWEGIESGSRALAAGGGTMFFDMPLNAHPPTVDAASFDQKLAVTRASSLVDFAFWGGLIPGNVNQLQGLSDRGVIGFKAFMSNSGIEDFPRVDDATLREGMQRAAELGQLVAVHAESEAITSDLAARCAREGRTGILDFLDSRPIQTELDAIKRALELAQATKCALHVVHVSSGAGVALIAAAAQAGVNVTCETCPHYLTLTEDDVVALGAVAKCAPPLRSQRIQEELWTQLENGGITSIGSDHSPCPPGMKQGSNFFKAWGGISGVQHTLSLLLGEGHLKRKVPLPLIGRLTCTNVSARFRLPPEKSGITIGADADLCLVDLNQAFEVRHEDLLCRHKQSPYVGRKLTGRVVQTILRGRTIFREGKSTSTPFGKLVKPLLSTK
jgi:allantoinase